MVMRLALADIPSGITLSSMTDLDAMHRIGIWDGLVWIAYE